MPSDDTAFEIGTALGSGATANHTVKQPGADKLSGIANRSSTTYDIDVRWLDESESTVETERIATNVSANTQTAFDVVARSPYATVQVVDNGSAAGAYDLAVNFR